MYENQALMGCGGKYGGNVHFQYIHYVFLTYTFCTLFPRNSLDVALQDSKTELARIKELLNVYESVGPGFEALVKQYTQLTAQIDNKKWALSELKRTQQAS